jgi:hypothetical protein
MESLPAELQQQIASAKSALKHLRYEAMRIKQRPIDRAWKSNKYQNDPDYREKIKKRNGEYARQKKEKEIKRATLGESDFPKH